MTGYRTSILSLLAALLVPLSALAFTVELGTSGKDTALANDPGASGGTCVAVRIDDEGTGQTDPWPLGEKRVEAGRYRFTIRARFLLPEDFDQSRLIVTVTLLAEDDSVLQRRLIWSLFDGTPGAFTVFTDEVTLARPALLRLGLQWRIAELPPWMKDRPARPVKPPSVPTGGTGLGPELGDGEDSDIDDLAALVMGETAVPLSQINYPAVLMDQVTVDQIPGTLTVEKVWPDKVHIYPGQPNPITVTVRNRGRAPARSTIRLTVLTGLAGKGEPLLADMTVPANSVAEHRFPWTAGTREFGHEARAELLVDGRVVHAASEYFSVSLPVWKTAIQGGGFLTWYGREHEFPEHVANNRRHYVNVEEAFSWQPSSWTDLNPTGEDWWSGQNNFHNSRKGLRTWMSLSHTNGIKMITYLWASASGPAGIEWGRQYPQLVTHQKIGLGSEFHDIEDLRLYDLLHDQPELWDYQYGVWHSFGLNRGMLGTMIMGADEVIASARRFGWDGVRFDSRPTWSAMGAQAGRAEARAAGIEPLMQTLIPEFYGQAEGNWTGSQVSIRNIRYMKHRFLSELGPQFAVASNYGLITSTNPVTDGGGVGHDYFRAYCRDGCQVNQEVLRKSRSWATHTQHLLDQVEHVRRTGGFHAVQSIDDALQHGASAVTMNILMFAAGSHPYCYRQFEPSPGQYARFATRYGEFLWSLDLAPVTPATAGLSVESAGNLLWQRFVRERRLPDGTRQTVMQLITPPRQDAVTPQRSGSMPPWRRNLTVTKQGAGASRVWLLSAEPNLQRELLTVTQHGNARQVVIPEHRLWSTLVWNEEAAR